MKKKFKRIYRELNFLDNMNRVFSRMMLSQIGELKEENKKLWEEIKRINSKL